jgi:hypothetical protein
VNIIFNKWIKGRWFAWWCKFPRDIDDLLERKLTWGKAKYNYVLAAALDTGLALPAIVIFFCITYPGGVFPDWWGKWFLENFLMSNVLIWTGNTVYLNTADGNGLPWLSLPESGRFRPANGTWH